MTNDRLKPFRRENIPAYMTVLGVYLLVSTAIAALACAVVGQNPSFLSLWIMALVAVMAGMSIMFVASLLNLSKMRSGFARLAAGESNPRIPSVWCPVLTAATQACTELAERLHQPNKGN